MYLLDTNHCSKLLNGDAVVSTKLAQVGLANCSTSTVVVGELFYMVEHSTYKAQNRAVVNALVPTLTILAVDKECAEIYGRIKEKLYIRYVGKKGLLKRVKLSLTKIGISENDLWIAVTTIRNGCTMVSRDEDFSRIQAVEPFPLESWY